MAPAIRRSVWRRSSALSLEVGEHALAGLVLLAQRVEAGGDVVLHGHAPCSRVAMRAFKVADQGLLLLDRLHEHGA